MKTGYIRTALLLAVGVGRDFEVKTPPSLAV